MLAKINYYSIPYHVFTNSCHFQYKNQKDDSGTSLFRKIKTSLSYKKINEDNPSIWLYQILRHQIKANDHL